MAGGSSAARIEWVDAAKGLGIILVVIAHVWTRGPVRDGIYAFHMPLFFLLSGYMVQPQPSGRLFVRQARALLIPFASFATLLIAVDFAIEGARGHRPIFADWGEAVWTILLRTEATRGPFTILWFVPCLFAARLVWNMLARRWPDPTDWRWPVTLAAMMAAAHGLAEASSASPFGLMGLPAALLLFWVGQLWRGKPPGRWTVIFALAPFALVALVFGEPVNLKAGDYGVPLLSLAGAVAISIVLCHMLEALPSPLMGTLAYIGRASLVIMYAHVAFIHYGAPLWPKWMLLPAALVGSLLIDRAARATRLGGVLLLGRPWSGKSD